MRAILTTIAGQIYVYQRADDEIGGRSSGSWRANS